MSLIAIATSPMTPPTTKTASKTAKPHSVCTKCGTIRKSGLRSCCARDGDWFKNCGDPGDLQFEHTWFEGIQACEVPSSSSEAGAQAVQRHHETSHAQQKATHDPSTPQQKIIASSEGYGAESTDGQGCRELAKITAFMSIALVIFHNIQM